MNKIMKYLSAVLAFLFISTAFVACQDDDELGSANVGLGIKVFAPTRVVSGTPMTINGSGFANVAEVEFPGGIKVTSFETIGDDMIRITAPTGLSQEGTIIVRNNQGESVESRLPLTIGKTVISGASKQAGELIKGKEEITFYGEDLQFVNEVELIDEEGNPLIVEQKDFVRLASTRMVLKIPNNVFEGTFVGHIRTFDNKSFNMPELEYEQVAEGGGHWETIKKILWENSGMGPINWSSDYRFSSAEKATGEECYAFPMEDWDIIKNGTFKVDIQPTDWVDMKVTTGWWSTDWSGGNIQSGDERFVVNEDGTWTITICMEGDPIQNVIDDQHLLFTGGTYTVLRIYTEEEVWVGGGGHFEKVKTSYWLNGRESEIPAPNWSGEGRFSSVSGSTGEETYAFPDDIWEKLMTEPFRIRIEKNADWVNLRVTTGWWSTNYLGMESLNDLIEQDEDGNYYVELNLSQDAALMAVINSQHLLFTGSDYKLLEIYTEEEVWVDGGGEGGGAAKTIVWENGVQSSIPAPNWSGEGRFSSEENKTGEETYAIPMDQWNYMKDKTFYIVIDAPGGWANVRITTGWWSATYGGADHNSWDEAYENADGEMEIAITPSEWPDFLGNLDQQHLLFTGSDYTLKKIYY